MIRDIPDNIPNVIPITLCTQESGCQERQESSSRRRDAMYVVLLHHYRRARKSGRFLDESEEQ